MMQDFFGIITSFDLIVTCIALFTFVIIFLQLLLGVLGAGEWDVDVDGDGSFDFDASMFLSPIGIIRFLCGASWYLVFVNMSGRSIFWYDYLLAIFVGFVCFAAMAFLYWVVNRLAHENVAETGTDLIGRAARIYLPMSNGTYVISVEINGSLTNIHASSEEPEKQFEANDLVTISSYENGIYYIK